MILILTASGVEDSRGGFVPTISVETDTLSYILWKGDRVETQSLAEERAWSNFLFNMEQLLK